MYFNLFICNLMITVVFVCSYPTNADKRQLPSTRSNKRKAEETRIKMDKACVDPVPKLFPIEELFPMPNGRYTPHCVILHRCDKDAGCCGLDKECGPANIDIIQMHIFAYEDERVKIYEISFQNHTQCECKSLYGINEMADYPEVRMQ